MGSLFSYSFTLKISGFSDESSTDFEFGGTRNGSVLSIFLLSTWLHQLFTVKKVAHKALRERGGLLKRNFLESDLKYKFFGRHGVGAISQSKNKRI